MNRSRIVGVTTHDSCMNWFFPRPYCVMFFLFFFLILIQIMIITCTHCTVTFTYSHNRGNAAWCCNVSRCLAKSAILLLHYDLYLPAQTQSPCMPEISPCLWQNNLLACHLSQYLFYYSLHVLTEATSGCSKVKAENSRWQSFCCCFSSTGFCLWHSHLQTNQSFAHL